MPIVIGSKSLSDDEFLAAFATCELPSRSFRHGDHLRLAWIQLHRRPIEEALDLVRRGIQQYTAHHGSSHLFHETITAAWVRLLSTHREPSFAEFIAQNEHRLNAELLHRFWSPDALKSELARTTWLPPDRQPLPHP